MLAWLSVWSEVQTCIWPSWCHCHSLSLALIKSRLVLTFWYWLTRVVLVKWLLNGCVYDHMFMYSFTVQSCFMFLRFYVLCRPTNCAVVCYERHCTPLVGWFMHWLYCIYLFSCTAASQFNKLTYLLTHLLLESMGHLFQMCRGPHIWNIIK